MMHCQDETQYCIQVVKTATSNAGCLCILPSNGRAVVVGHHEGCDAHLELERLACDRDGGFDTTSPQEGQKAAQNVSAAANKELHWSLRKDESNVITVWVAPHPMDKQTVMLVNNIRVVLSRQSKEIQVRPGDVVTVFPFVPLRVDVHSNHTTTHAACAGRRPMSPVRGLLISPTSGRVGASSAVRRPGSPLKCTFRPSPLLVAAPPTQHKDPFVHETPTRRDAQVQTSLKISASVASQTTQVNEQTCIAKGQGTEGYRLAERLLRIPHDEGKPLAVIQSPATPLQDADLHPPVAGVFTVRGRQEIIHDDEKGNATPPKTAEDVAQECLEFLLQSFDRQRNRFVYQDATLHARADLLRFASSVVPAAKQLMTQQSSHQASALQSPVWCCGDLHGSFADLHRVVDLGLPFGQVTFQTTAFLFLGDYVDRGDHSVEVVLFLLAWKVLQPQLLWLLRGNHEDPTVNGDVEQYGDTSFLSKCVNLLGDTDGISFWQEVNMCFSSMPLFAVVDRSVFACHGGVPQLASPDPQDSPVDLRAVFDEVLRVQTSILGFDSVMPDETDNPQTAGRRRLARELMWNDPCSSSPVEIEHGSLTRVGGGGDGSQTDIPFNDAGFRPNVCRGDTEGVIHEFNHQAVEQFLNDYHWSFIIRAHQHKAQGVEVAHNGKVITLFSSCNYSGSNAAGACLLQDQRAHLVTWHRPAMSPPRSLVCAQQQQQQQDKLQSTERPYAPPLPSLQWSCGVLPSSCHLSRSGTQRDTAVTPPLLQVAAWKHNNKTGISSPPHSPTLSPTQTSAVTKPATASSTVASRGVVCG